MTVIGQKRTNTFTSMDKRALKILSETYWSSIGWKRGEPNLKGEDFEYAKSQGVMFDPIKLSHDEAISRLGIAAQPLSPRQVADGFLASLSTRRLEWRSALGSYSVARWLPNHEATPGERQCHICGLYGDVHVHDLSLRNFTRFKWGGVSHSDPVYAALDLQLFQQALPPGPKEEDFVIFRALVEAISSVPPSVTSSALHKYFPSTMKANKAERDQVVAILGLCGVLGTVDHPGFWGQFIPSTKRKLPDRHFVDMPYPACWWKGSDGMHVARLRELFAHAL